eukprot:9180575-Pyramimonas_sp.AAC.1
MRYGQITNIFAIELEPRELVILVRANWYKINAIKVDPVTHMAVVETARGWDPSLERMIRADNLLAQVVKMRLPSRHHNDIHRAVVFLDKTKLYAPEIPQGPPRLSMRLLNQ